VVLAKALTYGGTLGAAGGVAFLAYSQGLLGTRDQRRIRRLIGVLLVVAVIGTAATIGALANSMSGDARGMFEPDLLSLTLSSGEGEACAVRLAGVLLMVTAFVGRPSLVLACLGAVAAATSFAWIGHVHALTVRVLPLALIGMHLVGAAFWIGALGPLYLLAGGGDLPRIARTTERFGTIALAVVGVMLLAGGVLLVLLLPSVSALWSEAYGRLFLGKMALVSILLAFAAFNHWRLTPRLVAQDERAARSLRRSIGAELTLAVIVLVVTATLTTVTGP
jgi:putative copper export protein